MSWFRRREREPFPPSLVDTLAQALATALSKVMTSQSDQIEQQTKFLGVLQDLSAKKAAQVMGQRGGRVTQERRRAAKVKRGRVECVLCADPMHRGTTLEQIQFHRMHEGVGSDSSQSQTPTDAPEERGN